MVMPTFTMRQLLEAGVHFGHTTRRWNPKMKPFIFGARNGIHILNLELTVPMLNRALEQLHDVAAGGGRILFVGTKRQAQTIVQDIADKTGMHYVNHRWLGGMLTNWKTVTNSVRKLKDLEARLESVDINVLTKRERLGMERSRDKLGRSLNGIKTMSKQPDLIVVFDTEKDAIAVQEARCLGIPVIGLLDSNSNPENITFPIVGNDDAMRALNLYADLFVGSVLEGLSVSLAGTDSAAEITAAADAAAAQAAEKSAESPTESPAEEAPAETVEEAPTETPAEVSAEETKAE